MTTPAVREFYEARYSNLRADHVHDLHPAVRTEVGAVLATLRPGRRRILDFGCNVGGATRLFTEAGHDAVGVDVAPSVIAVARAQVPAARFEVIHSEATLPFEAGSFDMCFASEVIEHLFDVEGFISEIHRVLLPGSPFVLTAPYHGRLKNLAVATFGFERHFLPTGTHIRFFTPASLTQCLRTGGFNIDGWQGVGRFRGLWKLMLVTARKD